MNNPVILYGGQGLVKPLKNLRAGDITADLMEDGSLQSVRMQGREIVRSLQVTVRDSNWGTVNGQCSSCMIEEREHALFVSFQVIHRSNFIDFRWKAAIELHNDGRIVYTMDGEAHTDFLKNRLGFCLLHPMDLAGSKVEVETTEGPVHGLFSKHITPQDPFVNIRSMTIETNDQMKVEIAFEGDLFQTEDQRNWTDGSYKTFCTPLHLPYPVEIKQGTRVAQSVSINIKSDLKSQTTEHSVQRPNFTILRELPGEVPKFGTILPPLTRMLTGTELLAISNLHLSHVRCSIDLTDPHWRLKAENAFGTAQKLNADIEVELIADYNEHSIREAIELMKSSNAAIKRIAIYPENVSNSPIPAATKCDLSGASLRACQYVTTEKLLEIVREYTADQLQQVQIGGGSRGNFAELNRTLLPLQLMDFLEYAVNPQVHASDLTSIIETLPALSVTVQTAELISGGLPIHIGAVSFKGRMNPYAADDDAVRRSQNKENQLDHKLKSLFGAGWTLGAISNLSAAGVQSINLYEAIGALGMIEEGDKTVHPVYHIISQIGELSGGQLLKIEARNGSGLTCIAIMKSDILRIIAANLTDKEMECGIDLSAWGMSKVRIYTIQESNYSDRIANDSYEIVEVHTNLLLIKLPPFSCVFIDSI